MAIVEGSGDSGIVIDPLIVRSRKKFPRLSLAGTDSEVALWNLKLLRKEFSAVGIDWDGPAPTIATMEEPTREDFGGSLVEAIRPQESKPPVP